jgi:hypothetical protein
VIWGPLGDNRSTENASGGGVDPPNALRAVQTTTMKQRNTLPGRLGRLWENVVMLALTGRFREGEQG